VETPKPSKAETVFERFKRLTMRVIFGGRTLNAKTRRALEKIHHTKHQKEWWLESTHSKARERKVVV
jgi:hypothetical protein